MTSSRLMSVARLKKGRNKKYRQRIACLFCTPPGLGVPFWIRARVTKFLYIFVHKSDRRKLRKALLRDT